MFLKTLGLKSQLEQPPLVDNLPVPEAGISVKFSVHTWFKSHNRAQGSYTNEPHIVEWLKSEPHPGDIFWDVGANVGAYSVLAAKLCPGVQPFAFEPFIPTFSYFWENILLNSVRDRVFALNLGPLNRTTSKRLAVNDVRAGSSQHQVGGKGVVASQFVISLRIHHGASI